MKNKWIIGMMIPGMIMLLSTGCKDKENDVKADTSVLTDNAEAEFYFNDIYKQISNESGNSGVNNRRGNTSEYITTSAGCADSIKVITNNGDFPKTLIIYFNNTACDDGKTRSGIISATLTGKFFEAGTAISVTLQSFSINGTSITGTKTIIYNGLNTAGNINFDYKVENGRVSNSSGTILWKTDRNHEWSAGMNTLFYGDDDEFTVTGSANGVDKKGRSFSALITSDLILKSNCRYITKGIININSNNNLMSIDYGDGTCDNKAMVTYGGSTFDIELQ